MNPTIDRSEASRRSIRFVVDLEVIMLRSAKLCTAISLLLTILSSAIYSQILDELSTSNLGGRDSVSGTIFLPDRKPAGRGIQVKLNKGGTDAVSYTNHDGRFYFNGVGNGTYTLTVEAGEEYEPTSTSQRFEVSQFAGAPPQTHYVNVQLRLQKNAIAKPSVIDADLAKAPKKAQQNYLDARTYAAKGDFKSAVGKLVQAIEEYPEFSLAHADLGLAYMNLNELEKADKHLSLAWDLKPGSYDPLANLGIVLSRMKKFGEAEAVIRVAIKIKDESAVMHFYLGRALAAQNKLDEAEIELRKALSMDAAKMVEAHRALANLYLHRKEDQKALTELEAYLAANPKAADAKKLRDTIQQIKDILKGKQ